MARTGQVGKVVKHGSGGLGWTDVPNIPYTGPGSERELPAPIGNDWFPQVEAWWEICRVMPHCVLWEPSDWLFAIELCVLKNNFYAEFAGGVVHASMASEIRRREDQLGWTLEARRKLGIRYVDPAQMPTEEEAADARPADAPAGGVRDIKTARSRRQQLAAEAS